MKPLQILGIYLLSIMLLGGCKTSEISPREAFLATTQTMQADYLQLYEVSPELLRERDEEVFRATKIATRGARDAMQVCSNSCPALHERLNWIDYSATTIRSNRLATIKQLEANYDSKSDTALFFHLYTVYREELGWAVMRGRTLKSRIVLDNDDGLKEDK